MFSGYFGTQKFSAAWFEFYFQRIPIHIILALYFPAVLLEFLSICTFFLPLDLPDRTIYSVTILLAFYFLQTQFLEITPRSPKPSISNYQMVSMLTMAAWIAIYSSILCFIAYKKPHLAKKQVEIRGRKVKFLYIIDIGLSTTTTITAGCTNWILAILLFVWQLSYFTCLDGDGVSFNVMVLYGSWYF